MIYRKVIAASISGAIFAILFGLFVPDPTSATCQLDLAVSIKCFNQHSGLPDVQFSVHPDLRRDDVTAQ